MKRALLVIPFIVCAVLLLNCGSGSSAADPNSGVGKWSITGQVQAVGNTNGVPDFPSFNVGITVILARDSNASCPADLPIGFSADNSVRPGSVACSQGCSGETQRVVLCTTNEPMMPSNSATFYVDPVTYGTTYLELIGNFDSGQITGTTCYQCNWPDGDGIGSFTATKK
jgi:hypothetical protein